MKTFRVIRALAAGLLIGFMTGGCAAQNDDTPMDPLEGMNRFFFDMNQRLDRHAALPAASFYHSSVPAPARTTFHNVLDNLGGPVTCANDLLQLDFSNAGIAAARFIVNTTIGVAGIFDVATGWGLPGRPRDFGETLGTYGVPPGPYLVLPLRGSTDVRDFTGNYLDGYFSPLRYVRYDGREYIGLVKSTLGSVDTRSANIITFRDIERASVDYYATMRAYYLQRRQRQIEDRAAQMDELPDF
ncbi:MAG TPA: VacJ family lipoprotein [Rhizomicrobium sp.]|jgi:phospholipid-binding lipoprotein MlaA|nr:VacJ family lipoprotein [Rhizomicrobium sp.]